MSEMAKLGDEHWGVHGGELVRYVAIDLPPDTAGRGIVPIDDKERLRLASVAPEFARLLLEAEWSRGAGDYGKWDGTGACPWCEEVEGMPGHKPDCRLVALLVRAGLR